MTSQAVQILYIGLVFDAESYNAYKSSWLHHITSYDVIQLKYWQKNLQILEKDFGIPQNWKPFRYLSNFKFLVVTCDKI